MDALITTFSNEGALLLVLIALGPALAVVHRLLRDVYQSEPWRTHPQQHWD